MLLPLKPGVNGRVLQVPLKGFAREVRLARKVERLHEKSGGLTRELRRDVQFIHALDPARFAVLSRRGRSQQ